jgi:predicted MFS family arabinose efflux permease
VTAPGFGSVGLIRRDPVLRMVVVALFLLGAGICSFAPYQSLIAHQEFGLTDAGWAAVLVVSALIGTGSSVGIGILTDRTGRRRGAAVAAAALWLAGPALVAAVPSQATFVLAHVLLLPMGSAVFPQLFVLARMRAQAFPEGARDGIQATVRAAFAVPFIAILPLWSVAIGAGVPLMAIYGVVALTAAGLLMLVVRFWPRDAGGVVRGPALAEALPVFLRPGIVARLLAVGAVKSGPALYMTLLGLVMAGAGRGEGDVALFAGLVAGGEIPVMLMAGWLLARVHRTGLIALAAVIHAGFLAGYPLAAQGSWVWLMVIPAAMGAGIILSVPMGYLQDLVADRPGAGGALLSLHQLAGDAMAALAFAVGTAVGGYATAAAIGAATVACGGLALLALDRGRGMGRVAAAG